MRLTKIPSIFRNLALSHDVETSPEIVSEEGSVIVAQALDERHVRSDLELLTGGTGTLVEGDVIAGVLGKRRAACEFSGDIPDRLRVGEIVYLLGSCGVLGSMCGGDPSWGHAMSLRVLGGVRRSGAPVNLRDAAVPWRDSLEESAPLVAVMATCMESGKTTTVCQVVKHFSRRGLRVAYAKLTGFAYRAELLKVRDYGAERVMDFVDGGLPSTCGSSERVVKVALGVLADLNRTSPDVIVIEFGASILGEYNVLTLLGNPEIVRHIKATVVAARDTVAAWGARELLSRMGMHVSLFTGPVANNPTEIAFIESTMGVAAENNLNGAMPKTMTLIENATELSSRNRTPQTNG